MLSGFAARGPETGTRVLRILYVDDDADIREVAELCLRLDPQMDVRALASAAEALALLDSGDFTPEVVMLDVMMPEMDGPSLLAAIQARGAPPKAIFITARALPSEVERLTALGAVGVITKPFDPMGLAGEVRRLAGA